MFVLAALGAALGTASGCGANVSVGEHDAGHDGGTPVDAAIDAGSGSADDAGPGPVDAAPDPVDAARQDGGVPRDAAAEGDGGAPAESCGGFVGLACSDPGQFCDWEPNTCGAADASGTCRDRPRACAPIIAPVCGCDGRTYGSECAAHAAGVDVASPGPCDVDCAPDDARGVGFCGTIVGIAWNGTDCTWLSGCSCEGRDCGRYTSLEECEAAHAACPVPAGP